MQQSYPQKKGIEQFLKEAFGYWSRTLVYQVLFSLVYFSVFFLVFYYSNVQLGLLEKYENLYVNYSHDFTLYQQEAQKIAQTDEYVTFFWIMMGTLIFLYPLNLGLFKIFRKLDLGEKPEITDLFAGYSGVNFFLYISYAMLWFPVFMFSVQTLFLAGIWILITLFTAPLMFFMNKRIFETFSFNIKAIRMYLLEIIVCLFVAIAFKYIGMLTCIAALFTFPFTNAMIYALYKNIFNEGEHPLK